MQIVEGISEREELPLFGVFLRRIGFKNFKEYVKLFGDDIEKRKEAVRRFKKEYKDFSLRKEKERGKK